MIRVAALTSGTNVPSTRFRVRQYIEPLKDFGIQVKEYPPRIDKYAPMPGWPENISPKWGFPFYVLWQGIKLTFRFPGLVASRLSDITWLERQILPGFFTLEFCLSSPLVFDVDDAIWLARPFGVSAVGSTAKRADVVIVGNNYLANWFSQYSNNIKVIPTAIDTDRFRPLKRGESKLNDKFTIGWTGTSGNLPYLKSIETALWRFMRDREDAQLMVIADKRPEFGLIPSDRLKYIPWSIEVEADSLRAMDVGIMPLPDNEWTRGKCSFKMLQYMASGLPVIVSPVGMNQEIINYGDIGLSAVKPIEWYEALEFLYNNRSTACLYGQKGRTIVERFFSKRVVAAKLATLFKELI